MKRADFSDQNKIKILEAKVGEQERQLAENERALRVKDEEIERLKKLLLNNVVDSI